ncbi:MAG TPA: DUF2752 domain-containing protein [Blastocatellia bacterium]|nr:DUF2752 domain-containing protein [Blastocatellia bacterium]
MNVSPAQQQVRGGEVAPGSRPSKALAAFALLTLSGVFLASILFSPPLAYSNEPYFTICGFKNFTGLPCPGCGLTHSFCALGKGDLLSAFGFNLLGPPLFLLFVLVWARSASVLLNKHKPVSAFDRMAERFQLVRAFVIAFAVFGAARITYLLIQYPELVRDSPMSKLVARLFR